jgi:hypothetical protein
MKPLQTDVSSGLDPGKQGYEIQYLSDPSQGRLEGRLTTPVGPDSRW